MTLLNDLEVDNALRAPIEVGMYLANRGNGRAKILQGNVTLLFGPRDTLPKFNVPSMMLPYDADHSVPGRRQAQTWNSANIQKISYCR